jgi:hypothetical protein
LELVKTVDSLISYRVLVFGSPRPRGVISMLAGAAEVTALERGLPEHGFVRG